MSADTQTVIVKVRMKRYVRKALKQYAAAQEKTIGVVLEEMMLKEGLLQRRIAY